VSFLGYVNHVTETAVTATKLNRKILKEKCTGYEKSTFYTPKLSSDLYYLGPLLCIPLVLSNFENEMLPESC